jgi:small subunit ribosomal protein S5
MEPNKGQSNKQSFSTNRGGQGQGGFGGRGGGGGQRYGGRPQRSNQPRPQEPSEYYEKVVQVNRVSKKTKGGDKRSLSVLVVVGDRKGKVGVGLGKAADVQSAVRKATTYAKRHMIFVPLKEGRTILHQIDIKLGAAKLLLKPAPKGTGVIAGGPVRVVVEAAGIHDVVSKILGTNNKASNVYATLQALRQLTGSKYAVADKKTEDDKKAVEDAKIEKKAAKEAEKSEKVTASAVIPSQGEGSVKKEKEMKKEEKKDETK